MRKLNNIKRHETGGVGKNNENGKKVLNINPHPHFLNAMQAIVAIVLVGV